MKVAIPATGGSLSAQVDERFGRAPYVVLVDTGRAGFTAVSNQAVEAPGGAGTAMAQLLKSNGVEVVLTGRVGPNARRALEAAGIEIVEGITGQVQAALDAWLREQPA